MTHTPEPEESEAWNPNSDEQSMAAHMRMTKCLAACAGIPTDKLRPGIVRELMQSALVLTEHAEYAAQFLSTVAHGAAGDAEVVKARAPRPRNMLRQQAEIVEALLRELGEP